MLKITHNKSRFLFVILLILALFAIFIFLTRTGESAPVEIELKEENLSVYINQEAELDLSAYQISDFDELEDLSFVTLSQNQTFLISPTKYDAGLREITLNSSDGNQEILLKIEVKHTEINWGGLKQEIQTFLGARADSFGIYVHNLLTDESMGINENKIFPPASTAKMPLAVLILRDVEDGKLTLEDTIPLQPKYTFQSGDDTSSLPAGTNVTIRQYLEDLIVISSNTAWFHLIFHLGGPWGGENGIEPGVNQRTIDELGLNPFFMDPYQATAKNQVQLLRDLYTYNTLGEENAEYLLDLMKSAIPWAREAIGSGLPEGVEFANKIGTHSTPDLVNYVDMAIVWGVNTDYAISILNENVEWIEGQAMLKTLSEIVYKYVDNY